MTDSPDDFYDEPDPEFRTEWEREADEADEKQIADLLGFFATLSRDEQAIKRLADTDPLGYALCGQPNPDFGWTAEQADAWLESRLYGKPAEE